MAKLIPVLCMISILTLFGCKKEEVTTATASTDSTAAGTATDTTATEGTVSAKSADQAETRVDIQIVGTSAIVEPGPGGQGMTLILPKAGHGTGDAHVPFLAWLPDQEVSVGQQVMHGQKDSGDDDKLDRGNWRFHQLDREEITFANDLSGNPLITPPAPGPCDHDLNCLPRARDLLAPARFIIDPKIYDRSAPPDVVRARLDMTRGVGIFTETFDRCNWEFRTSTGPVVASRALPGVAIYQFKIQGTSLTIRSRKFDARDATDILTVQATDARRTIKIRIGNSPKVFPDATDARTENPDHHYSAYYDLLVSDGGDSSGSPVDPAARPLPHRPQNCPARTRPTITCGPGGI